MTYANIYDLNGGQILILVIIYIEFIVKNGIIK